MPAEEEEIVIGFSLLPTQLMLPEIIKSDPAELCGSSSPFNKRIVPGKMFSVWPLGTVASPITRTTPDQLVTSPSKVPETSIESGEGPRLIIFLATLCWPTSTVKFKSPGSKEGPEISALN